MLDIAHIARYRKLAIPSFPHVESRTGAAWLPGTRLDVVLPKTRVPMNLENQTALITGSSGGIGEDFAVAFAQRKVNLVWSPGGWTNWPSCAAAGESARGSPSTSSPPTSRCPDRRPNWQPR